MSRNPAPVPLTTVGEDRKKAAGPPPSAGAAAVVGDPGQKVPAGGQAAAEAVVGAAEGDPGTIAGKRQGAEHGQRRILEFRFWRMGCRTESIKSPLRMGCYLRV